MSFKVGREYEVFRWMCECDIVLFYENKLHISVLALHFWEEFHVAGAVWRFIDIMKITSASNMSAHSMTIGVPRG